MSLAFADPHAIDHYQPVNWNHPLSQGLRARWQTIPVSRGGNTWYDLTGRFPGVLQNIDASTDWVRSYPGGWGSLRFNGTDGWVDTPFLPPTGSNPRAFSFWIRPLSSWDSGSGDNAGRHILEYGTASTLRRYTIKRSNGSVLRIEFDGGAFVSSLSIPTGQWSFVCVSMSGTTIASHLLFVNGVFQQASGSGTINTGAAFDLAIGRDVVAGLNRYTDGEMDDVNCWDRALSRDEITNYYDLSQRFSPGLLNRISTTRFFAGGAPPDPPTAPRRRQKPQLIGCGVI